MDASQRKLLIAPIVDNNPITLQILGICSALAVTTKLAPAITMSLALTFVLVGSNLIVSLIRRHLPSSIRIIVMMTIIASLVILVDQALKAFAYELSKQLSVFVGLIITNCIVLGRAEAFAAKNNVLSSLFDGLGMGLGFTFALTLLGATREFLGTGRVFDFSIFAEEYGMLIFVLAPGAFIALGYLIAVFNKLRKA